MFRYLATSFVLIATSCMPVRATAAEVVKIGIVIPMTGSFQSNGREIAAAMQAYQGSHGDMVAGRKVEFIIRDDASQADNSLRLSQELVVRDKVAVLAGFGNTPAAISAAQISARARVPQVIMVAATSSILDRSPYMVRVAQTIPQIVSVVGDWAPKNNIKTVVTLVSDYGPGTDAEEWFVKTFEKNGGKVLAKLRVPVGSPDFSPFLQRVADEKPDALFVFVPTGVGATFMKQFVERGLDKSGIRMIGTSDVMDDELVNGMGDVALGVVTAGPYSAFHDSPENKTFVTAFKKTNPAMRPNVVAVGAWDALDVIYKALDRTKGDTSGDALLEAMKGMTINSPRGPITIDPATRDIVQNIYMRRVERREGELYNVEFETIPQVKDPAHKGGS